MFSLYAYIDMDSDVMYLSSDDESVFDHNQRLLREHYKYEDRLHIQNHLSRVLEEVKEGKRKFLRTAAFSEPSSIPVALPLDQSLAVTVAYEPGNLNFNIMSQESQIGSLSPPPVVRARNLTYEALQYQSTITNISQISPLLSKHGLEISPEIVVRVPRTDERSCHAPKGSDKL